MGKALFSKTYENMTLKEKAEEMFEYVKPLHNAEKKTAEEVFNSIYQSILFMNKTAEQLKVVIKNDKFKYYDTTLPKTKDEVNFALMYLVKQVAKVQEELRIVDLRFNKEEYRPKGGQGAPVNLTYADELRKAREAAEAQYKAQEEGAQQ